MFFTKNQPLEIITCDRCRGAGSEHFFGCPQCKDLFMGVFRRGYFLYWGEPINLLQIKIKRARVWLNRFQVVGALIFALGFLFLFFYNLYLNNFWLKIFTTNFWIVEGNKTVFFWLAIIFLSYLLYRLARLRQEPEIVEKKNYRGVEREMTELINKNWLEITKMSRHQKKDISRVFTSEAKSVLTAAYLLAYKNNNEILIPLHLFSALLASSRVSTVFLRLGVSVKLLQAQLAKFFVKNSHKVSPQLSADWQQILFQAYELAYALGQEYVNVTELLIITVRQSEVIQEILYDLKIDKDKLENVTEWMRIREHLHRQYKKFKKAAARRSKYGLDRAMTAVATPYLNSFSEDLTMAAKYGYLSPCVGREEEIKEIFRIIEGGRQSVVLVGESGVGKMSLVEGIAQKMVEDDVPQRLQDKRLVQLSISALLAGTTVSGAQERLMRIMQEIAKAQNIVLFIKNIDDLIGTTSNGEGLDVSETLAEYLGPGKFLTFATANVNNYNQRISNTELGTALARVDVKEMNENQAIQVLESKVGSTEYKHNVFFSYDAIAQCVRLAKRFLHEQNLPESALAIMTEVASFVHNEKGENQLVLAEDVGAVVSTKTGIPTTALTQDESDKLLRLEQLMHERVIGQEEAVGLIANALRRARVEIRSTGKPIASFLFLGPTGVGKTELAKTIAEVYFGGENQMIRLDMSEYQDKIAVYRLIGEPGTKGTGILTEAVRQKPFSLVLLDELEKADPNVLTLFLQVFDDGRLTDSTGRVIDFTNTIVIATSNAGTLFVQEQLAQGVSLESVRQQLLHHELKQYYRPEFINRFDGVVLFKPLAKFEIKKIADLMLRRVAKDLEKRGVALEYGEEALSALAEVGFDPDFGARPMRRAIQDKIENQLADLILQGRLERRDVVVIGADLHLQVKK